MDNLLKVMPSNKCQINGIYAVNKTTSTRMHKNSKAINNFYQRLKGNADCGGDDVVFQ